MNAKNLGIIVVILVLAAGGYYVWTQRTAQRAVPPATPSTTSGQSGWTFKDEGFDDTGAPHTTVSLNGRTIGSYIGQCNEIKNTSWPLLPGESEGVICWWAGGGNEIGVFGRDVKAGVLGEGSQEVPSTRSGFKTLFSL